MSKEQQSAQDNDEALFITAFSYSNKKGASRKIIPVQPSLEDIEIRDLMKKC